jgi:hypothetical protein
MISKSVKILLAASVGLGIGFYIRKSAEKQEIKRNLLESSAKSDQEILTELSKTK